MSVIIRSLTQDDAFQMRELRLLALKTDASAFGASYEEESKKPLSFFENRCTSTQDKILFGAFDDQTLVAITNIVREAGLKVRQHASIYAVYTHPDYRGRGISKSLLNKCIDTARQWQGVEYLQLGVATNNLPALTLYQQVGFKVWGTQSSALRVNGEDIDEHYMALKL